MKQKIKDLFRRVVNKLFRKKTRGIILGQKFDSTIGHNNVQIGAASFKRMFESVYPDAAKFMDAIKEMPVESNLPAFLINGHICTKGSLSAASVAIAAAREIMAHEVSDALKEWSHEIDVRRISVNRIQEGGNFILQIIFRKDATGDENLDEISQTV